MIKDTNTKIKIKLKGLHTLAYDRLWLPGINLTLG